MVEKNGMRENICKECWFKRFPQTDDKSWNALWKRQISCKSFQNNTCKYMLEHTVIENEENKLPVTPYQMAINNVAIAIRNSDPESLTNAVPSVFRCSEVLALAFCKSKEEIVMDIVKAGETNI